MRHGTHFADTAATELEAALASGPFHVALRAAIRARGLSLQRVQHHLARHGVNVGVTSLSYWQQGARRPQRDESLRAVRALEEILQLPDESLIRLLTSQDPASGAQRAAARSYRSRLAASGALELLLAELGSPREGGLQTMGHHERVRIGTRRELLCCDSQLVVRAHAGGGDRYVAVHHGDPGCDPGRMSVHAVENCRTGRVLWSRETGVLAAELLFDTRLRPGDTHVFRYAFEDGTADACHEYVRGFGLAGGQYVLQVRFAPQALPVRCHRFTQHSAAAARSGRQELPLSGAHHCVHLVEPQVRAGLLGIGWDWE
ncbi:hypothetical protein GCM10018793_13660 [Streptomyces sulfonofaciens]|uniref:Uncharacterized protein n=1 Tax=Streptomyces sulfonofaciens TaxID=68272 RepID=A0A919FY08_9ACTN|nr:helix-turn-helix transcriptional regulator [Streptomyces sulfonofaciens]GHH73891.1 hypothetical protein GCM10018793_13660 [Streptomyces sulfonofaciens]